MKDLTEIYNSFETGIRSAKAVKPKAYLNKLGLSYSDLRIGFNSGQFHHREPQEIKDHYESFGMLTRSSSGVRDKSMTAYTVFGSYGIVFPLVNEDGRIVNLFAVRFNLSAPIEDYLNKEGIYPAHPHPLTKRLFITPTLLDCATIMQSKVLDQREAVISLHNGEFLPQHQQIISGLKDLEEIIIIKR